MLAPLHLEIIPNLNIKVLSPIRKRKNEKTLQNCWALGFNFFSTLWTQYCNQLGRYNILHLSTVRHSWTRDNYQQTDKIKIYQINRYFLWSVSWLALHCKNCQARFMSVYLFYIWQLYIQVFVNAPNSAPVDRNGSLHNLSKSNCVIKKNC